MELDGDDGDLVAVDGDPHDQVGEPLLGPAELVGAVHDRAGAISVGVGPAEPLLAAQVTVERVDDSVGHGRVVGRADLGADDQTLRY